MAAAYTAMGKALGVAVSGAKAIGFNSAMPVRLLSQPAIPAICCCFESCSQKLGNPRKTRSAIYNSGESGAAFPRGVLNRHA